MRLSRCTFDQGMLHHAFITRDGHAVYRCTSEDSFNDKGRYFILTSAGPIEVMPIAHKQKNKTTWTIAFVDTERRRLQEEAAIIQAELDKRAAVYNSTMLAREERLRQQRKYNPRLIDEEEENDA